MSTFSKFFGGTMGVLFAIGFTAMLGIGGCVAICGGVPFLVNRAAERTLPPRRVPEEGLKVEQVSSASPPPAAQPQTDVVESPADPPVEPVDATPVRTQKLFFGIEDVPVDDQPKMEREVKAADPEKTARTQLDLAKGLLRAGKKFAADQRLKALIDKFPGTEAATEAEELLNK